MNFVCFSGNHHNFGPMITKCMLRTGGGSSEVNFASGGGGSEFSDSSSSVSIDEIVGPITGRSRFFHTSADSLFNGEPMVTLMEASDDGEDLQGIYSYIFVKNC